MAAFRFVVIFLFAFPAAHSWASRSQTVAVKSALRTRAKAPQYSLLRLRVTRRANGTLRLATFSQGKEKSGSVPAPGRQVVTLPGLQATVITHPGAKRQPGELVLASHSTFLHGANSLTLRFSKEISLLEELQRLSARNITAKSIGALLRDNPYLENKEQLAKKLEAHGVTSLSLKEDGAAIDVTPGAGGLADVRIVSNRIWERPIHFQTREGERYELSLSEQVN